MGAIALTLVKVPQLAADLAEIRDLDINPLLADRDGVVAVDARSPVAPLEWPGATHPRFAIRPYPKQWERRTTSPDGTHLLVRPVRPEDEELVQRFFGHVTADDLRLRLF